MSVPNSTTPVIPEARKQRLRTLEKEIGEGLEQFYYTGMKLKEIRDDHLYEEDGFKTWKEYCRQRWEWSDERARQLIVAAEYREILPAPTIVGDKTDADSIQWSEASVRELTRIKDKNEAARVAQKIVNRVEKGGEKLTARLARKVVKEELGTSPGQPRPKEKEDGIDPEQYMRWKAAAIEAIVENLQRFDEDAWRLLRRKSLPTIKSLGRACKALGAFLERVEQAEDPRPPEASSEPYQGRLLFHTGEGKSP
jgi:hypothetical protein